MFATIAVNAKIHAGAAGRKMWLDCVKLGIDARKDILRRCHYIRPFVAPAVHGKPWQDGDTDEMAHDLAYFTFEPVPSGMPLKAMDRTSTSSTRASSYLRRPASMLNRGNMKILESMPIFWRRTCEGTVSFRKNAT